MIVLNEISKRHSDEGAVTVKVDGDDIICGSDDITLKSRPDYDVNSEKTMVAVLK